MKRDIPTHKTPAPIIVKAPSVRGYHVVSVVGAALPPTLPVET